MIVSFWALILIPIAYLSGWLYWFAKHSPPSVMMPRIISFHKISDSPELGGTFNTVKQFRAFMKYLKSNGYKTVAIDEILKNPDDRSIVIFFDDAYESVYTKAFPIMKEYNYTGVLCPIADFIGKKNTWDRGLNRFSHLNRKQLKEMAESGFEIICHSKSHRDLRRLSKEKLQTEISDSKKMIEEIIGREVSYFIYPFGLCNERVKSAVKSAGYKGAFSSYNEKNNSLDMFAIGRNTLYIIDTVFDLKILLNRRPLFMFGHEDQKGRIINWFSRFSGVIRI